MRPISCALVAALFVQLQLGSLSLAEEGRLTLTARYQTKATIQSPDPTRPAETRWETRQKRMDWDAKKTAIIVCDMWDDHWCKGAAARVTELAAPMNALLSKARTQGALIIHAPSTTVDFYKDTPQRKRALAAPYVKPPVALSSDTRWGTGWCYPDKKREPELPIDDSDMGCDCREKCEIKDPWKRQIKLLEIHDADVITDNGQELVNVLAQHKIDHVLIMGVHLNMCVLGRPFGIRQLSYLGKEVVLVRDMTDTMYNSQKRPFVDHFAGTDLVVDHVEKYWCPTVVSTDLTGEKPFRFREDRRTAAR